MKQIPALDGLRAVAILAVVANHVVSPIFPSTFGVTLFFFISGFIITRLLLDSESVELLPFYVRRFFRLTPALVVYVGSCLAATIAVGSTIVWPDVAASLLYYANYHEAAMECLRTMWSLAVEEHFYLFFPLLLLVFRKRLQMLQAILVIMLFACLAWRYGMVRLEYTADEILRHTESRIDSIAFGCLLSVLVHRGKTRIVGIMASWPALVIGFALLCASFAVRDEEFRQTLRFTLQGMAFFALFCGLFFSERLAWLGRVLSSRPMLYVGRVSYSLYLYHEFGLIFGRALGQSPAQVVAITLAVGLPATLLSFYYVEGPGRRLGVRLAKRIHSVAPAARTESASTA